MTNKTKTAMAAIMVMIFMFVGVIGIFGTDKAQAANDITVYIDGDMVTFPDAKPYINSDNRTLVPVRFISEYLGAEVKWDAATRVVTILQKQEDCDTCYNEIKLTIDSKEVKYNGEIKYMDTTAVITQNRTMVPLRFVSEYLGAEVEWDSTLRSVFIFTKGQTQAEKNKAINEIKTAFNNSAKLLDLNTDPVMNQICKLALSQGNRIDSESNFNNEIDIYFGDVNENTADKIKSDMKALIALTGQNSVYEEFSSDDIRLIVNAWNEGKTSFGCYNSAVSGGYGFTLRYNSHGKDLRIIITKL